MNNLFSVIELLINKNSCELYWFFCLLMFEECLKEPFIVSKAIRKNRDLFSGNLRIRVWKNEKITHPPFLPKFLTKKRFFFAEDVFTLLLRSAKTTDNRYQVVCEIWVKKKAIYPSISPSVTMKNLSGQKWPIPLANWSKKNLP